MQLRRRDMLLATGLTLIFGSDANARILLDGDPYIFPARSTPRRLLLRHAHTGEVFSGVYRDDIGPIPEAMIDLAVFLRDHREDLSGPDTQRHAWSLAARGVELEEQCAVLGLERQVLAVEAHDLRGVLPRGSLLTRSTTTMSRW